jgi:MATE family multidrug resistance protein
VHGVALALLATPPLTAVVVLMSRSLDAWGLDAVVLGLARPYLDVVTWSLLPLLLYAAFRRYLQAMGAVRPVMVALLIANVANVIANWALIFGNLGAPALGVEGAAWATVASRIVMAGFLFTIIVVRERGRKPGLFETPLRVTAAWMRRLLRLGFPAAIQVTLEVGVFAAATALAGRLTPSALAAHQIAINFAAVTYMVPLGISSAGAVRVGHAVGRSDRDGASSAGWTAIAFGCLFMTGAAIAFVTIPHVLIGFFTSDAAVLHVGVSLLAVAAVFQLFDGLQAVSTGVLRGLGDTRMPMLWNLAGHWFIGLPLGYAMCFPVGLGVIGLWWGLSTGLMICGVALLVVWVKHMQRLRFGAVPLHDVG